MVICLERGADLHMARLVLPVWYWLTWVVPDKGPLNGCVYVCVVVVVAAAAAAASVSVLTGAVC